MYFLWMTYRNEGRKYYLPSAVNWSGHLSVSDEATIPGVQVIASNGEWSIEAPDGFAWEDGAAKVRPLENCRWLAMRGADRRINVFCALYDKQDTAFRKFRLPPQERVTIGAMAGNALQYAAPTVSRSHGEIVRQSNGSYKYVDHSSYGSYINGALYQNASCDLRFGDVILILPSLQIVFLDGYIAVNNAGKIHVDNDFMPLTGQTLVSRRKQEDDPSVVVEYHRSPRHMQQPNTEPIEIESPLEKEKQRAMPTWLTIGPSITMVLPMLVSSLVSQRSVVTSLAMMGTSSALAVMWGFFNRKYQKEQQQMTEEDRQRICKQYYAEIEEMLAAETERERKRLLHNYMSVEDCMGLPAAGEYRLWERMPSHEDFLSVRLGLGERQLPMPLSVEKLKISLVDDPLRREPQRLYDVYHTMHDVPILLDISKYQIIGVLGNKAAPWLLQSLVVQIAAMHSYHDVRIAIIHDASDAAQWHFAKWLPHAFASDDRTLRMVVSEENAVSEVFSHIDGVLTMRADQKEGKDEETDEDEAGVRADCIPWYVVICTDPKLLEDRALMRHLTTPGLGFTLLLQTPTMELLPKECRIIIESKEQLGAVYHTDGEVEGVKFEMTSPSKLDLFSKRIAPFRIKETVENS